jgi:hypothetical protein
VGNRRRALGLLAILVGLAGAAILAFQYYRSQALRDTAALVRRLPSERAAVLHIDVAALRQSGLLARFAGAKVVEEPDYRKFVEATAFDYRSDLDSVSAAFAPAGAFFLLRGRFDWAALSRYAQAQGGRCHDALCEMAGSQPGRIISFFPLRTGLMAMAVSSQPQAAIELKSNPSRSRPITPPPDPVWISIAEDALRDLDAMPAGTRAFARAVQNSPGVMISLAGGSGNQVEARLSVECRSDADARAITGQLTKITQMLRDMIAREGQKPNPHDLSGVLTSGEFRQEGQRVRGRWLLTPSFLDSLLSGAGSD